MESRGGRRISVDGLVIKRHVIDSHEEPCGTNKIDQPLLLLSQEPVCLKLTDEEKEHGQSGANLRSVAEEP